MEQRNYTCSFVVSKELSKAYGSVSKHIQDWWTGSFQGRSEQPGDKFSVHFGETFVNVMITEAIPYERIVWQVTDSRLPWLKDNREWTGTEMIWTFTKNGDSTEVNMTHLGLNPERECYTNCEKGWDFYVGQSLKKYIAVGKGMPDTSSSQRNMAETDLT